VAAFLSDGLDRIDDQIDWKAVTSQRQRVSAHTYQWDAEARMVSVDGVAGQACQSTWTSCLAYNANGWVTRRSGSAGGGFAQASLHGPSGEELASLNDTNGAWYDQDIAANGRIIAFYEGSSETYFRHVNALGSTTALTNHAGAGAEDLVFYPWGQILASQGSIEDLRYAGFQEIYPDLGLYPTPTRLYPPNEGRWLTPDPGGITAVKLDDPQTWNMYAYAGNNPTTNTDPDGLDFMIACAQQSDTCGQVAGYSGLYQGATASTGVNGELQFTPTVVTQEGGELQDQYGMTYGGDFDQSGVHLWSADNTVSGNGQFVEGTKETDLFGQGLYFGVEGKFVDACGGSCKARGSISDLIPGSVGRAEDALNQRGALTTFFDRLSGAHDKGTQWMDSAGTNHVIRFAPGTTNAGKTELHFEGSPVQGINVIPHLAGAFKDLVTGDAAAHRAVVLP
jgi:RHS repeat-associated protein